LGISLDKLIFWHKYNAIVIIGASLLKGLIGNHAHGHGFRKFTGWLLALAFIGIYIASQEKFRRNSHEWFLKLHIIFNIAIVFLILLHGTSM
jgi:hypothetical protein